MHCWIETLLVQTTMQNFENMLEQQTTNNTLCVKVVFVNLQAMFVTVVSALIRSRSDRNDSIIGRVAAAKVKNGKHC